MKARPAAGAEDAHWAVDAIQSQLAREGDLWTVGRYVPESYEAFARIFHEPCLPDRSTSELAQRFDEKFGPDSHEAEVGKHRLGALPRTRRTWAAVAESNGKVAHPLMQWWEISAGEPDGEDWEYGWEMEPDEVAAVADALSEHTSDDQLCNFLIWIGYNIGELAALGAPRITLDYESYFVLEGPLKAASTLEWRWNEAEAWPTTVTPPNAWWPADRAWFLSFGIDEDCTYAGGSKDVIRSIVEHPRLEAFEIDRDDRLDEDPVNRPAP